jgi:hypothetical protein
MSAIQWVVVCAAKKHARRGVRAKTPFGQENSSVLLAHLREPRCRHVVEAILHARHLTFHMTILRMASSVLCPIMRARHQHRVGFTRDLENWGGLTASRSPCASRCATLIAAARTMAPAMPPD